MLVPELGPLMKTSRLTSSQKSEILEKYLIGASSSQLAKEFGCSPNTVSRTVRSLMSDGEYKKLKIVQLCKSKYYYKNTVSKLIDPNIKFDDNYCNEVFDSERHWIHRKNPITASEIWNSWPNNMKEIFLFYFNKYNIKNICDHFDYKIKF